MNNDMERCDVCQGCGKVVLINKTQSVGYSVTNVINFQRKEEQCPKCDGKGMVKKS